MKTITLLCFFVSTAFLGLAQNVFTNGTFDTPAAWTVIQQNTNNNATAIIADGVVTFDDINEAGWGAEGHVAIYKSFTVAESGWYQFDAEVITNGLSDHWFELYVGTTTPVDESEYNTADFGAVNLLALSTWDCGDFNTYSGSWLDTDCKGLDGKIELDASTTYYALVRTGGITWGAGVVLDNLTLVTTEAPPAPTPLTNFNFDFDTPTTIEEENLTFNENATNTVTDGINTSTNVGELTGVNNNWWSQIKIVNADGIDLSTSDRGLSVKVKGPRTSTLTIKIESGGDEHAVTANYTTENVWQTLTFDFSAFNSTNNTKIALFFDIQTDFDAAVDPNLNIFQVDDLVFGAFASLGVEDFKMEGISVSPNPTNNTWNVSSTKGRISSVTVFDILGKKVISLRPNTLSTAIDASNLTSGIYITKISTDLGSTTKKLIKH